MHATNYSVAKTTINEPATMIANANAKPPSLPDKQANKINPESVDGLVVLNGRRGPPVH
jgi:hypothetical protein